MSTIKMSREQAEEVVALHLGWTHYFSEPKGEWRWREPGDDPATCHNYLRPPSLTDESLAAYEAATGDRIELENK